MTSSIATFVKVPFVLFLSALSAILSKRRGNLIEFQFTFEPPYCHIRVVASTRDSVADQDALLITTFIHLLARYFYICDDRQIQVVGNLLRENNPSYENFESLPDRLYETVFHTLTSDERKAAASAFAIPLLAYSDTREPVRPMAKYSFSLFRIKDSAIGLGSNFQLSYGPDKILLPLTLGFSYQYVADHVQNTGKLTILEHVKTQLLDSYETENCRTLSSLVKLPNDILTKNGVLI